MEMSDRELLEFAAKAAGIRLEWDGHPGQWQPMYYEGKTYHAFNPLEDDGDALRLAMTMGMSIYYFGSWIAISTSDRPKFVEEECPKGSDLMRCVRLAITRAAAEIGKAIQEQPK